MQVEDDRDGAQAALTDIQHRMSEVESGFSEVRIQMATVLMRLTTVESDLAALKTGVCIAETRLAGIENRQRHAEACHERQEARLADLDYGVDRVHVALATLEDRVRGVALDFRELSGTLCRGPRPAGGETDTLAPLSHAVSRQVGFKGR